MVRDGLNNKHHQRKICHWIFVALFSNSMDWFSGDEPSDIDDDRMWLESDVQEIVLWRYTYWSTTIIGDYMGECLVAWLIMKSQNKYLTSDSLPTYSLMQ